MGQENVRVLCPECGTPGESDPEQSRWQCSKCGNGFFLRRCSWCARVSYVDGLQGFHIPWPCTWCGQYNRGFSPNQDQASATAAELAAEVNRYSDPGNPAGPRADGPDRAQAHNMPAVAGRGSPGVPPPRYGQVPAVPQSGRLVVRNITLSSPRHAAAPPGPGQHAPQRIALSVAAVVACAAAVFALLTAGDAPRAAGSMPAAGPTGEMTAGGDGPGTATRVVHVSVGHAGTVNLQGVPGQLVIVGTGQGKVMLTGQVRGIRDAPVVMTRLDRAADVLVVSIRCASADPCAENLRLAVPADTGMVVQQSAGQVAVADLAGSLRVTGSHLNVTANGLRSPTLAAVITSGHLDAAFTVPPQQVSITLTYAQAAVQLPDQVAYRINQQVMSGYIHVTIPQASGATRTVIAQLHSSELELLAA
jgi:hypothetical protein